MTNAALDFAISTLEDERKNANNYSVQDMLDNKPVSLEEMINEKTDRLKKDLIANGMVCASADEDDANETITKLQFEIEDLRTEVQFWRDMRKVNRLIENAEALSAASRKCMEEAEKLRHKLVPLIEKYEGGLEL